LVYYGYRDYSPALGRWLSRDPVINRRAALHAYLYSVNAPVNVVDYLGLYDIGKGRSKCGACEVKYEKGQLPDGGAKVQVGGLKFEPADIKQCTEGSPTTGPSEFCVSYPKAKCVATVIFDPDDDPEVTMPGIGITRRAHEDKHVQCMADAFDYGVGELAKLAKKCNCDIPKLTSLADLIIKLAGGKDTSCSYGVDIVDYSLSTDEKLKELAGTEATLKEQTDKENESLKTKIAEAWKTL
jgi:hypothetical protein